MCRHLAYVGPAIDLDALVLSAPHGLEHQSHAPRHQLHSTVNADGFGVAWYDPTVRSEPARYRTTKPIWADQSFRSFAPVVRTGALLAAVRSATPPLPVDESATAPFVDGTWCGSLNGFVEGFLGEAGLTLRNALSRSRAARLEANNDGEVLCALVFDRIEAGVDPADAVAAVTLMAERAGAGPKNLLVTDGTRIVATAWENSLFALVDHGIASGGLLIASEPLDDDARWHRIPDRHVLSGTGTDLTFAPIGDRRP